MVRHGLAGIAAEPGVGLKALLDVSGAAPGKRLTSGTVGFGLAPRINAAGRLERAMMAVELLTTADPVRAREIALILDDTNLRRQQVERQILDEAKEMIKAEGGLGDRRSIVLGRKGWHAGVIGIVAGRLAEMFHRPSILVAHGRKYRKARRGRSRDSTSTRRSRNVRKDCIGFGGHPAAAGLKSTEDNFRNLPAGSRKRAALAHFVDSSSAC